MTAFILHCKYKSGRRIKYKFIILSVPSYFKISLTQRKFFRLRILRATRQLVPLYIRQRQIDLNLSRLLYGIMPEISRLQSMPYELCWQALLRHDCSHVHFEYERGYLIVLYSETFASSVQPCVDNLHGDNLSRSTICNLRVVKG